MSKTISVLGIWSAVASVLIFSQIHPGVLLVLIIAAVFATYLVT